MAKAKAKKQSPNQQQQQQQQKNDTNGDPGRPNEETVGFSRYDEQQNDEIEVLSSVFPEDFETVETKGAWSKKSEKSFRLKLVADSDSSVYVYLQVTFTATYPKTVPLLSMQPSEAVLPETRQALQQVVSTRPRELVGEVMILELSNELRDTLEDAVQAAKDAARSLAIVPSVPSLEEERASREAAVERKAREDVERETKRQEQEKAEEERTMQQLVEDEIKRRDILRQKRQPLPTDPRDAAGLSTADVIFDQPVHIKQVDGDTLTFQAVTIVKSLGKGPIAETMEVRPVAIPSGTTSSVPCLTLKRFEILQRQAKKAMLDLEDDLERLKGLSHENLLNVFDFQMTHVGSSWRFDVLLQEASGLSLDEVLRIAQSMPVQKARGYAVDILQALDFLHKNGLVHGALHKRNVFICSSGNAKIAKLSDGCFQNRVYQVASGDVGSRKTRHYTRPKAWEPPEGSLEGHLDSSSRKVDIWDFGAVLIQMLMGTESLEHQTPQGLLASDTLTEPLRDLVRDALRSDPRKRPSAFDLIPYEFLRTDCEALQQAKATVIPSLPNRRQSSHQRTHQDESGNLLNSSRYANEWFEVGRLGKGGYGEVVKARNKLDGRVYAIKKITGKTQVQLSEVLSEVYLLATLNHPYVVRYYGAWPEEEGERPGSSLDSGPVFTPSIEAPESSSGTQAIDQINFGFSGRGLDFISSSGYPKIEFGDDTTSGSEADGNSDAGSEDEAIDPNENGVLPQRSLGPSRPAPPVESKARKRATLYIQMEFCEKLTLRDVIRRGTQTDIDETWRLFRLILEGLAHIHSHGIIHRDLKPENVFIDMANNPKIGDFGLATTGQAGAKQMLSDSTAGPNGDMTMSVGTALYVAPELQSSGAGNYTEKVDMYSLGIIFFEMCHTLATAMERVQVLMQLRKKEHGLPPTFESAERQTQGDVILSLVGHKPSERPTSTELLHSGKVPVRIEDEQIRQTLSTLSDPTSPYFSRMIDVLLSQTSSNDLQARMWDHQDRSTFAIAEASDFALMQNMVKERMTTVFRRYGAAESSRQGIFPQSDHYPATECAHYLDASGTVVQLPYDLILPHARAIAHQAYVSRRSFAFGTVFRASTSGGPPRTNREADFDIVSKEHEDGVLAEAEIIKCLDDVISEFPCFDSSPMCFHISHSRLLDAILGFCRIPTEKCTAVKGILGRLHIGTWTWQKIRTELRAPAIGISSSSIDDLMRFDFRDTAEKAFKRLQAIFKGTVHLEMLHDVFTHISGLNEYLKRFATRHKVYLSPLSNLNDKFYRSDLMFQCIFDTKKRDIFAAGGRYDSLIKAQQVQHAPTPDAFHAVGTNIAWDRIVTSMLRFQRRSGTEYLRNPNPSSDAQNWSPRLCDVLVASFDPAVLRSTGIMLVAALRASDISAELAVDTRGTDQLLAKYKDDRHSWLVVVKHEGLGSGKPDLKVRPLDHKAEATDVQSSELVNYLKSELRERDERQGSSSRARLLRQVSSHQEGPDDERKSDVHVLMAEHKSKKTNKARVIGDARHRVKDLLSGYGDGPIAAVETRDETLEKLRDTRLSNPESWREVIQHVPLAERQYCHHIRDLIEKLKDQYGEVSRKCFIYNFRTGFCIDYDMWA